MKKNILRVGIIILSVLSIMFGVYRGETKVVFSKAVNICLECIGLG